jgi:hypothetical protein
MTTLLCPECQYENEAERIYCHDCGSRLDRSKLAPKKVEQSETAQETQQRLKKMFDPAQGRIRRTALKTVKFLAGAVCCAAVVVMFLPGNIPPETKNLGFPPMIHMDLIAALSNRQTAPLSYTQEQVNSYLSSLIKRKDSPAHTSFFPITRLLVEFQEGVCTVKVVRQIYGGLTFTDATTYRVHVGDGRLLADPVAGFIGQMPVHPALLKAGNPLVQLAWTALNRERDAVKRLAAIEFHPQAVTLVAAR